MAPSAQQYPRKTFFLSNFDAVPGGRISLGNIFADPFSVNDETIDTLSKPVATEDTDFLATNQKTLASTEESIRETRSKNWSAELWAKFVALFSLNASAKRSTNSSVVYEIDQMTTVWLDDGIRAYANSRVSRESLLDEIVNGSAAAPIYMVVGIKYVRGLRVWIEQGESSGGSAKADANLSGDGFSVSAGGGGEAGKTVTRALAREIDREIVFAYRLAKISKAEVSMVQDGFLSDHTQGSTTLECVELSANEEQVFDALNTLGLLKDEYELESLGSVIEGETDSGSADELACLFLN